MHRKLTGLTICCNIALFGITNDYREIVRAQTVKNVLLYEHYEGPIWTTCCNMLLFGITDHLVYNTI